MNQLRIRIQFIVLSVFIICTCSPTIAAEIISLDGIKLGIAVSGAKWAAGDTSVSLMSDNDKAALTSLQIKESYNYLQGSTTLRSEPAESFPVSLDWRNKDGKDWTTPIRNQGSCGSCWAFGSIAVLESLIEIKSQSSSLNPNLSEQFFVSCSGGSCNGWYLDSSADYLKSDGVTDESCFIYQAANLSCGDRCTDWQDGIEKISNWGWVGSYYGIATIDELKAELVNGPVYTLMAVYSDFYYYTGGVYQHVSGGLMGYHAVAIVGWDDVNQCWIVKNSWGTSWGENGWFRIKMGTNEALIEEGSIWFDIASRDPEPDPDPDPEPEPDPMDPVTCDEDDSGAIDISTIRSVSGSSVTVPVLIQDAPNNVSSLGFEVTYPSEMMTYTGFDWGLVVNDFDYFDCSQPSEGVIRCGGFILDSQIGAGDSGDVVNLTFDTNSSCNDAYLFGFQNLEDDIESWDSSSGCFICTDCSCDVNNNSEITTDDGLCILQKYLGICPTDCGDCADICGDFNGNGISTPGDSLEIYKFTEGMDSICPEI